MKTLRYATPKLWLDTVLADFNAFLIDHAAAEKKASGMALSMLSHYPDKPELVKAMVDLSIEELTHFRSVIDIMHKRGLRLSADIKDAYVNQLRANMRKESEPYFLDRLLVAAVIEARGCERFAMIATGIVEVELKKFYTAIAESESRHGNLFYELALNYFPAGDIEQRLDEILDIEAAIVEQLPLRSALH